MNQTSTSAKRGKVIIVQGAQWGSEGKGMIAALEASDAQVGGIIRTGGPNAGHTVYHNGVPLVMNQIPTGWVNPSVALLLGPGAIIDPETLLKEIDTLHDKGVDVASRLKIHPNATILLPEDRRSSKESGRYYSLGGTAKGSSEALIRRLRRTAAVITVDDASHLLPELTWLQPFLVDTTWIQNELLKLGQNLVIEGTQGCHLDSLLGPVPKTTHRATNSAALLAEAGLSPRERVEVGLVARTFPIRVAGDSGPMPGEISWFTMLERLGLPEQKIRAYRETVQAKLADFHAPDDTEFWRWSDADRRKHQRCLRLVMTQALNDLGDKDLFSVVERTSVTGLVRRIAEFNLSLFDMSARWSGCDWVALTFANYVDPVPKTRDEMLHSPRFREWVAPLSTWINARPSCYLKWLNMGPTPEEHHRLSPALARTL